MTLLAVAAPEAGVAIAALALVGASNAAWFGLLRFLLSDFRTALERSTETTARAVSTAEAMLAIMKERVT